MSQPRQQSKHFFDRMDDGSVRLRLKFTPEEASLFEEAAGKTPVMAWLHRTLLANAEEEVAAARAKRAPVPPPE